MANKPKPKKDHYLPAGLIGGFGELSTSGRLREAKVAVWFNDSQKIELRKAESVAYERGLYAIEGIPESTEGFDKVWELYERRLPEAAQHLVDGILTSEDIRALIAHTALAGARYAGFTESLKAWSLKQGRAITEAEARDERPRWIAAGLQVADWRWRVLHAPEGSVFVLPDTGYALLKETPLDPYFVFLPVSPRAALLVKRPIEDEPHGVDSMDHREVMPGACNLLNLVSNWHRDRTALISHPDRSEELERIGRTHQPSHTIRVTPYGGRSTRWW